MPPRKQSRALRSMAFAASHGTQAVRERDGNGGNRPSTPVHGTAWFPLRTGPVPAVDASDCRGLRSWKKGRTHSRKSDLFRMKVRKLQKNGGPEMASAQQGTPQRSGHGPGGNSQSCLADWSRGGTLIREWGTFHSVVVAAVVEWAGFASTGL